MRLLKVFLFAQLSFIAACDPSQPASQPAAKNAVTLQFSKRASVTELNDKNSWCNNSGFTEATLINADPANSNRRFFLLGEGVYGARLQFGNAASSFFLRKAGEKSIELFTSDNFPMCLSRRANFSLAGEGTWFRYDNGQGIAYTVETQSSAEGLFVILTLPPTPTYGLTVHRCAECR